MTNYKNWVQDFPTRCKEVLIATERAAKVQDREVTLLLMTAAAGFIVPFERLRPDGEYEHPSSDKDKFPELAKRLQDLLDQKFLDSSLHGPNTATWKAGKLKSIEGELDSWPELQSPRSISRDRQVKSVVKLLRNTLAHGNLYTKGHPDIAAFVFVSQHKREEIPFHYNFMHQKNKERDSPRYDFLQVSPEDFSRFLIRWFEFLETNCIPQSVAQQVIAEAA